MSYEIQVTKHGATVDKNEVVYFQKFHRVDIEKLVHTINSAYWVDVEPDEEEVKPVSLISPAGIERMASQMNATMADSMVREDNNG